LLQQALDEPSFSGLVAAAEWTEEEGICGDARLRALEEARAKLNSLGPELAVTCLDKGELCRAVKVCMTAQEIKLECPPWAAARYRAKALLEAELDDGIRCRKPQQIMWACNARYGAAGAGVDAVRILGARECATTMLLDDVQDAISQDSACQLARAILESESAGIHDKVVQDAALRLEQLRADAEEAKKLQIDSCLQSHASLQYLMSARFTSEQGACWRVDCLNARTSNRACRPRCPRLCSRRSFRACTR